VLRYLKGTADSVFMYGGAPSSKVVGWSDSDYASDIGEQHSRTGYVFMLKGATVSWKSQRQLNVALSTAEGEYMALTAATQKAMFLKKCSTSFTRTPGRPSPFTRTTRVVLQIEIEIEIVYNNTNINRLLSLGPPVQRLTGLICGIDRKPLIPTSPMAVTIPSKTYR
jgi:hypothetical protein